MIHKYKTEGRSPKDFSGYQYLIDLFKNLRDCDVNQKEVLKKQFNFKSDLGKIKKGNQKSRLKYQISVTQNVENFFNLREKIIDLFRDYLFLLSEAKYKAKQGEKLKILTPKQMIQRLPIALTQLKTGNTSENVPNEIRKIIYSLYRAKEITENVYNNIMNSIKL